MSRIHLSLCAAGALLVLPAIVWANSLGDNSAQSSVRAFSYDLGEQAAMREVEPEFGETGPADL